MITADFHNHTFFSDDSDAPPESMVEQAIRLGLSSICITDHMDYLFPAKYQNRFTFNLEEYFSVLTHLKERFQDQIELLFGIELGLRNEPGIFPECNAYYGQLASQYPFDFIIGSTHVLEELDIYYPEFWELHGMAGGLSLYFDSILENIKNYDMFQVYGHLDYAARYLPDKGGYCFADYREQADEILKLLISTGRGLEVNTAGYKYGLPYAHPRPEILARYRELGGEILTIGSDAHCPGHLAYDFKKAREALLFLGYRYYTVFRGRKPVFLPL